MYDHLSPLDCLGIYHNWLTLVLYSRFARGTHDGDLRRGELWAIAVLFALRKTDLREKITPELASEWVEKINTWRRDVLAPADERMNAADPHDVMKNPRAYEPAFTLSYLTVNMGIVDVDRDRELMALGLAMHEEDSDRPRPPTPASDEELREYHAWLTEQGNTIARISDEGKIEIDPLQVKTWMEKRLEPVIQAKGAKPTQIEVDDEFEEALEALMATDRLDAVRAVRDARLAQAEEGSARWHVLRAFFELAQKSVTFRRLGEDVGLSASALQEAYAAELAAIRAALRAA